MMKLRYRTDPWYFRRHPQKLVIVGGIGSNGQNRWPAMLHLILGADKRSLRLATLGEQTTRLMGHWQTLRSSSSFAPQSLCTSRPPPTLWLPPPLLSSKIPPPPQGQHQALSG